MGNNCTKESASGPIAYLTGTEGSATKSFELKCKECGSPPDLCNHNAIHSLPVYCECPICKSSGAKPYYSNRYKSSLSIPHTIIDIQPSNGSYGHSPNAYRNRTDSEWDVDNGLNPPSANIHLTRCPHHINHTRRIHTVMHTSGISISPCNCVCRCEEILKKRKEMEQEKENAERSQENAERNAERSRLAEDTDNVNSNTDTPLNTSATQSDENNSTSVSVEEISSTPRTNLSSRSPTSTSVSNPSSSPNSPRLTSCSSSDLAHYQTDHLSRISESEEQTQDSLRDETDGCSIDGFNTASHPLATINTSADSLYEAYDEVEHSSFTSTSRRDHPSVTFDLDNHFAPNVSYSPSNQSYNNSFSTDHNVRDDEREEYDRGDRNDRTDRGERDDRDDRDAEYSLTAHTGETLANEDNSEKYLERDVDREYTDEPVNEHEHTLEEPYDDSKVYSKDFYNTNNTHKKKKKKKSRPKAEQRKYEKKAANILSELFSPYYNTPSYIQLQLYLLHPNSRCPFHIHSQYVEYGALQHLNNPENELFTYDMDIHREEFNDTAYTYDDVAASVEAYSLYTDVSNLMNMPCVCNASTMLEQTLTLQEYQKQQEIQRLQLQLQICKDGYDSHDQPHHPREEDSDSDYHPPPVYKPSIHPVNQAHSHSRKSLSSNTNTNTNAVSRPEKGSLVSSFSSTLKTQDSVHSLYIIDDTVIGEPGSFGRVVRVQSRETGLWYACKLIPKVKFAMKWEGLQQFQREVRIMQLLKHPNIIEFRQVFEDNQYFYIIMELCTGGELIPNSAQSPHQRQQRLFTEERAAFLLKQMVAAVGYMHEKGLVHCDIKPDNFLLSSSDPHARVKLIDFGLSKFVSHRGRFTTTAGTPFFIAPEVIDGNYNQSCDLWSLGVVMFIMLFGYPPFNRRIINGIEKNVFQSVCEGFHPVVKPGMGPYFPQEIPVSAEARDLIARLLTDSASRLTAEEMFNHPWLNRTSNGNISSMQIDPLVVKALRTFDVKCRFQQAVLHVMVDSLSDSSMQQLQQTFKAMDEDNNGLVSVQDLKRTMAAFRLQQQELRELDHKDMSPDALKGLTPEDHRANSITFYGGSKSSVAGLAVDDELTETEIEDIMARVDRNNCGHISFQDLLLSYVSMTLSAKEERMLNAFRVLDVDRSGRVDIHDLTLALEKANESYNRLASTSAPHSLSQSDDNRSLIDGMSMNLNLNIPYGKGDMKDIIAEVDIDEDGTVEFDDFLEIMWQKHRTFIRQQKAKTQMNQERRNLQKQQASMDRLDRLDSRSRPKGRSRSVSSSPRRFPVGPTPSTPNPSSPSTVRVSADKTAPTTNSSRTTESSLPSDEGVGIDNVYINPTPLLTSPQSPSTPSTPSTPYLTPMPD